MNTIKIYLKTSGSVAELHKDFAMYVGSYQNKLIDVYVPKEMLYSNKQNTFNNAVKIAGLLTATDGKQITTEARYLDYLKEVTIDGVDYIVYERRLPKAIINANSPNQSLSHIQNNITLKLRNASLC